MPNSIPSIEFFLKNFFIFQLKKGKLHEIQLNSQYYLEIEDTKYAKINGNTATGLSVGRTFVALRDRNIPIDTNEHTLKASLPKSSLTVTQANRLTLNLLPYYNWVTVEGERHEIALDLYTKDDQKITLGTNYLIKSTYDNALFYAIDTTNNGTRIYGEAIRAGTSPVTGSFQKLKANAEMLIYKGIDIIPQLVILPYDPNNLNR
jgi:nuclear pore complex protein Nup210